MDQQLKEMLSHEDVVVLTDRNMIKGTLCRHQAIRFSDSLNAPMNRETPYLVLVNADVTGIESGKPLFSARFLMVARSRIEVILPATDVTANHILNPPAQSSDLKGKWANAEQLLEEIVPLIQPVE